MCVKIHCIVATIMEPINKRKKPEAKHSTLQKKDKGNFIQNEHQISLKRSCRKYMTMNQNRSCCRKKIFWFVLWPKSWNTSFSEAAMEKRRKRTNANILKSIFPLCCSYVLRKMVFVLSCVVFLVQGYWKVRQCRWKKTPYQQKLNDSVSLLITCTVLDIFYHDDQNDCQGDDGQKKQYIWWKHKE